MHDVLAIVIYKQHMNILYAYDYMAIAIHYTQVQFSILENFLDLRPGAAIRLVSFCKNMNFSCIDG